ncbi:MAG: hypothetical protein AB7S87_14765, partial [Burkholderiales bacterium]
MDSDDLLHGGSWVGLCRGDCGLHGFVRRRRLSLQPRAQKMGSGTFFDLAPFGDAKIARLKKEPDLKIYQTPISRLLGTEMPIVQAPMAG